MSPHRKLGIGCLIFLTATGLTGCHNYTTPEKLQIGQCFQADASILGNDQPASQVEKRKCTNTHNSEVIGKHKLADGAYPGPKEIAQQANKLCRSDFEKYTGEKLEDSRWDIYPLSPTETSWRKGNERTLTCVALTIPEQKQSLKTK